MMEQVTTPRHQSTWWNALFLTIVVGLSIAFWLPNRFTPPPVDSDSYLFGFNNRLCQLILFLTLTCVAVLTMLGKLSYPSSQREEEAGPGQLSGRLIGISLGIASLIAAFYYWTARQVSGFVDTSYFLDRIHLIARGQVPFRDFEFIYGIAPLYGSLFLARLFHISPDFAYYLIWGGATLIGILLLGISIRWLDLPGGGKRVVFLLTCPLLLMLISMVTLNYSALRYTLPLFAITGLCRLDRDSRPGTRIAVVLFAAATTTVLLGISPEEGIVYAIAVFLYLPLRRYYAQRPFIPDILILLAWVAAVSSIAARAGTFTTMQRLGSGGAWYLPIYPGPHILVAFAAVFAMVFYLASGSLKDQAQSNVTFATTYGLGMLPGALGRCDAVHVGGYLLSLMICALLLSWRWLFAWRIAACAFLISFIVLPLLLDRELGPPTTRSTLVYHLYHNDKPHGRIDTAVNHLVTGWLTRTLGRQQGIARIEKLKHLFAATVTDPHNLFPGASAIIAAPFEYRPDGQRNYQAPDIDEGYFKGMLNVLTIEDVNRKIDDLRTHPEEDLVIAREDLDWCEPRAGDRARIRGLLQLPWIPQPKQTLSIFVPFCSYIRDHYQFVYTTSDTIPHYGLMRRKPSEPQKN